MYYIVYGFFYLVSLLPFPVMYFISSGIAFLMYHVFGYRKAVVMGNLDIAFPEKSLVSKKSHRQTVLHKFYRHFYGNDKSNFLKRCRL